jgi:hypothetical protein
MRYIFLVLILLSAGCVVTPRFQPSGDKGSQTEYYWAKKTCGICHKQCGFFKVMNKKKIVCADCYEKRWK